MPPFANPMVNPIVKVSLGLFILALPLFVALAMIILLAVASWAPALAVSVVTIGLSAIGLVAVWLFQNAQSLHLK